MSELATKVSKLLAAVLRPSYAQHDEPVVATAPSNAAGEALPTYGQADRPPQMLAQSTVSERAKRAAQTKAVAGGMIEVDHGDGRMSRYPPPERWDDWVEWDSKAWPRKVPRRYSLIPTICFNCESACGLLAYVDKTTFEIRKFEGNPVHWAAAAATAPRARRPTTRPTIPSGSCTRSSGSGPGARASGSRSVGTRPSTR
ncbi:MAG: hypothetical protein R6X02_30695 [Enhygromyxa sp.]